jgi:ribosome-associated toxin RatA of RatAB toxin-antitoxin module
MYARLFLFLWFAIALPAMGQAPPPITPTPLQVSVKRVDLEEGYVFEVKSSGTVAAAPETVWRILTDYERMPEFVPDMDSSRVISRLGNRAVVEQFGTARFLFIHRNIHLVVLAQEQPSSAIDISLISGDMRIYNCRWELQPIPETGGTRLLYTGRMMPKFYVPSMLGSNIIRGDIERMMVAVLARLDRGD